MTRDARGFTLLELLIALAIVAALLAVAFGGLRVGLAAWHQGEDRAEAHQHVRGVALALARVVEGAYPYVAPREAGKETQILFNGTADHLEIVTQAPPGAFAAPVAFAAVVVQLAGGDAPGLVVRQRALPNDNPFADDTTVVFRDPGVTSLTLGYLDDTGSWRDTWDADTEKTLPRAVRLEIGGPTARSTSSASPARPPGAIEPLPPLTVALRVLKP